MNQLFEEIAFVENLQYERIIDDILTKKYSLVENFFTDLEVLELRKSLLEKHEADVFKKAAIGNRVNEVIEKSIRGDVKFGMVIDFGDLKKIVKTEIVDVFDHATVFNKNTPHVELAKELQDRGHNVLLVDYQPTSEMMVIDFANKIKSFLPSHIALHSLKLQETDTSFAEWYASDN